jgi:exopolysaccharide biosynthesis polyprenyl glycosylphosphotransferase
VNEPDTVSRDASVLEGSPSSTSSARSIPGTGDHSLMSEPETSPPYPSSATSRPDDWRSRYRAFLTLSDLLVLVWVVFGTQIAWLGADADLNLRSVMIFGDLSYWAFSVGLIAAWMAALALNDSRSYRVIGTGTEEYRRVLVASLVLFGAIGIAAYLLQIEVARGFLLISLPFGIAMLVVERWLWRNWLSVKRSNYEYSARVLLIGSDVSVAQIAFELLRNRSAGYAVVGACVPNAAVAGTIDGTDIPIMGSVSSVERALEATHADTVIITSTDELPPSKVKQISWALEAGKQHLVLAPSIVDIAGPRLHTRPVAGLPLIHVETPRFSTGQRVAKRTLDAAAAAAGLIVLAPFLLILAILIGTSSPGPVLFRQRRVGLRGREFTMLKFRSMVADAEARLDDLRAKQDSGNAVLFKMANDPRVTPIGRFMRKFSLDEFPQLFNVLTGSMSLVGPRPPLPSEVAQYEAYVHRRFLVKPGITGTWQVSGRSTLSWEDSVRLDLSYVENWTLVGDLIIIARTLKAMVAPGTTAH